MPPHLLIAALIRLLLTALLDFARGHAIFPSDLAAIRTAPPQLAVILFPRRTNTPLVVLPGRPHFALVSIIRAARAAAVFFPYLRSAGVGGLNLTPITLTAILFGTQSLDLLLLALLHLTLTSAFLHVSRTATILLPHLCSIRTIRPYLAVVAIARRTNAPLAFLRRRPQCILSSIPTPDRFPGLCGRPCPCRILLSHPAITTVARGVYPSVVPPGSSSRPPLCRKQGAVNRSALLRFHLAIPIPGLDLFLCPGYLLDRL